MSIPQSINLSNASPAAPSGMQNVQWAGDGSTPRNVSANIPRTNYLITWGVAIGTPAVTGTDLTPHYLVPFAGTLIACTICAKTAPSGADLIVDLLQNGASLLGAAKLHLPAGSLTGTTSSFAGIPLTAGALLTLNVTQVGSPSAGQDVTIQTTIQI
jgi:hypothetical protein